MCVCVRVCARARVCVLFVNTPKAINNYSHKTKPE